MEKTSFLKEPVGGQSVVNKIVDVWLFEYDREDDLSNEAIDYVT